MYYLIFHSSIVQNIYQPAEASAQNENCRPFIHFRQQGRAPLTNRQRADILLRRGNIDGQRKPRIGGAYLEQLPEQLRIPVRSLDKNLRLPLAGRTPFQRPDRPGPFGRFDRQIAVEGELHSLILLLSYSHLFSY